MKSANKGLVRMASFSEIIASYSRCGLWIRASDERVLGSGLILMGLDTSPVPANWVRVTRSWLELMKEEEVRRRGRRRRDEKKRKERKEELFVSFEHEHTQANCKFHVRVSFSRVLRAKCAHARLHPCPDDRRSRI